MDIHAQQIRRIAREWRAKILPGVQIVAAEEILAAAEALTGISRVVMPASDPLLAGAQAVLDREATTIWQSDAQSPAARLFDAAHEYAHFVLHREAPKCHGGEDVTDQIDADGAPIVAITRVDGYSAQQRREYEANLFAAELLVPSGVLRERFFSHGWSAAQITEATGLSMAFVRSQFAHAILSPDPSPQRVEEPVQGIPPPALTDLDPSQRRAAEWKGAPFLLGAGPGTGKTRTLVARCVHLVNDRGVPPESILALTFSRKAAEEMRERLLSAGIGTHHAGAWIGTFHAFGLELLRRFGHHLGLKAGWRLLDGQQAFHLLESNLGRLNLSELDDINNPALHLRDILTAISRAKDELCGPKRYGTLAELMRPDPDAELKRARAANRTIETSSVYACYQELLAEANAIDFGDLIALPVRLLSKHPDVAAQLRAQYPHILADEYQDVNRACAKLVRLLAGEAGENLWLVGDHRQSIYRFRGASPANIAAFHADYPGGVKDELSVNYRSRAEVVALFSSAAGQMTAGPSSSAAMSGWESARGECLGRDLPTVTYAVAQSDEAQADGIARSIRAFYRRGTRYSDQAILCRTHYQAEILACLLAERDVPVICAQNLFDRPEARDLLAMLQAVTNRPSSAIGLVRLATIPEIGIPHAEAVALARRISESGISVSETVNDPTCWPSSPAYDNLRRIILALKDETDAAACLERFLFQETQYLRGRLSRDDEQPMRDLPTLRSICTVRQFLDLARSFEARIDVVVPDEIAEELDDVSQSIYDAADGRLRFLDLVRRTIASGDSPSLDLSSDVRDYDAVAMITAHAAKGLEFPVVFVPNLSQGRFPPRPRDPVIPDPPGMADSGGDAHGNQEEEECLFFVAISRAREHLVLCRPEAGGEHNTALSPSPLLALIEPDLRRIGVREARWNDKPAPPVAEVAEPEEQAAPPRASHLSHQLSVYLRCPRQYYYSVHARLGSSRDLNPGEIFSRAVNDTVSWLRKEWKAGRAPELDELFAQYASRAGESGAMPKIYGELYASRASQMLLTAREAWASETLQVVDRSDKLVARLDSADVRAGADMVAYDENGHLVIARHMLGKPADDDHTNPLLALLRRAADDTAPSKTARIELRYLQTATKRVIPPSPKWEPGRVQKFDEAAQRIARNEFAPVPGNPMLCARCPFLFICPS